MTTQERDYVSELTEIIKRYSSRDFLAQGLYSEIFVSRYHKRSDNDYNDFCIILCNDLENLDDSLKLIFQMKKEIMSKFKLFPDKKRGKGYDYERTNKN